MSVLATFSLFTARSDKNELGTWRWQRSRFVNILPTPQFSHSPHGPFHPPLGELNIPFFSFCFPLYLTRFHIFAQELFLWFTYNLWFMFFFGVYWQRIKILRDFITFCCSSTSLCSEFHSTHESQKDKKTRNRNFLPPFLLPSRSTWRSSFNTTYLMFRFAKVNASK